MAGFHVFPGGIVEESDNLPENHPLGVIFYTLIFCFCNSLKYLLEQK